MKKLILLLSVSFAVNALLAQHTELNEQLLSACEQCDVEGAKLLIEKGADVNAKFNYGMTAIFHAVSCKNGVELVKLLIENGADVNKRDEDDSTPLHIVAKNENGYEITTLLLNNGARINAKDKYGFTPLFYAAENENTIEILKLLIECGADINVKNNTGQTPIFASLFNGNYNTTRFLIKIGAEVNVKTSLKDKIMPGFTPLILLLYSRNGNQIDIVKMLIDKGVNVNAQDGFGNTALHLAATKNYLEIACVLLNRNADPSIYNKNKNTPRQLAYNYGNSELVELLDDNDYMIFGYYSIRDYNNLNNLLKRPELRQKLDYKGETIWHKAIKDSDNVLIEEIFSYNELKDLTNINGQTLLLYALMSGKEELAIRFIYAGYDISKPDQFGNTPYIVANNQGLKKAANLLKTQGSDTINRIKPILTTNNGHIDEVKMVEFSPNRKIIASASFDKTVKIWDIKTGKLIRTFNLFNDNIKSLKFSPNGSTIAIGGNSNAVQLYDVNSGIHLNDIYLNKNVPGFRSIFMSDERNIISNSDVNITEIAYSPNGKTIALGDMHGGINLVDASTGQLLNTLNAHNQKVTAILFSTNGLMLVSGGMDNSIKIWDVKTNSLIMKIDTLPAIVSKLSFTNDNKSIVFSLIDSNVYTWNFNTNELLKISNYKSESVKYTAFCSNTNNLIFVENDTIIKIWNIELDSLMGQFYTKAKVVNFLEISPNNEFVTYGTSKNSFNILELKNDTKYMTLEGNDFIKSIAFSQVLREFAIGYNNGKIKIFAINNGKQTNIFNEHKDIIRFLKYAFDGKTLACISGDSTIILWNLPSGSIIRKINTFNKINSIAFSPNGNSFVFGGESNMLLWSEISNETVSQKIAEIGDEINCVEFSPEGKLIIIGSSDNVIRIWNSKDSKLLSSQESGLGGIKSIAFTNNGNIFATGDIGKVIKLWETKSGKQIKKLFGHSYYFINSLAFSKNGQKLISSCGDKSIKIWDISSGNCITFLGHKAPVLNAQFLDDTTKIVSIDDCGVIIYWDIATQKQLVAIYPVTDSLNVVVTPEGYFDGTPEALKYLYYVQGLEIIPLEAYYEQFYRPNLLQRILNGEAIEQSKVDFNKRKPNAGVEITEPDKGNYRSINMPVPTDANVLQLKASFKDNGGGIDEVRVYRNNKLVKSETIGFNQPGASIERGFQVPLMPGINTITVSVFNTDRTEICDTIKMNFTGTITETPNLYIVSVGINDYMNPQYHLNYAVSDALSFSNAVESGAKSLYGNVYKYTITDKDASKANITKALSDIQLKAKPWDVFVFYYAGHGAAVADNARTNFYFIPYDVTNINSTDQLQNIAISNSELLFYSRDIQAEKQFIVIDACNSGAAGDVFAYRSGPEEERAIAVLARSTGTHFLFASTADQLAKEIPEIGHGVFTFAILEAMSGADGLFGLGKSLTVKDISNYTEKQVPELAVSFTLSKTPQYPTAYSYGQDFPLVITGTFENLIDIKGKYDDYTIEQLREMKAKAIADDDLEKAIEIKKEIERREKQN